MEHLDTAQLKRNGSTYVIVSVIANIALGFTCCFFYYLATQATTQEDLDSRVKAMKTCTNISIIFLCIFVVIAWLCLHQIL